MKRDLIAASDPRLHLAAEPVSWVNDGTRELAADLAETMLALDGVGLAATQVGVMARVCVVEDEAERIHVVVNPRITRQSGVSHKLEGCLSLPDVHVWVQRAATVTVRCQNEAGREVRLRATGKFAQRLQHEIDHLDGLTILERAEAAA